LLLNTSIW